MKSNETRILLINVSNNLGGRIYREYPLGIGILATIIQKAGYDVKIFDMALDYTKVTDVISDYNPNIIGLSFLSTSAYTAYNTLQLLKKQYSAFFIAGGIHPTLYYEEALHNGFDAVVVGEGENTILPLIERINKQNNYYSVDFSGIKGVAYKQENNVIYEKSNQKVELNDLPIINRDIYDLKYYTTHSIISSRGCLYRCRFCCRALVGNCVQMRSPEKIIEEIEFLSAKYGNITLYWADDMFFFNHSDRMRFCNLLIQKGINIDYIIQLRVDNINDELVQALKLSGCKKIALGAESGSNEILETIKKDITREDIVNAITCIRKQQLKVKTWWIVGLPGNYLQQLESLEIIKSTMPNEVAIHTFVPLPGSEFWNNSKKYGIHLPNSLKEISLGYYLHPDNTHFDYLSSEDCRTIINTYERELLEYGYVPTDNAQGNEDYVFTTPNQKNTFNV